MENTSLSSNKKHWMMKVNLINIVSCVVTKINVAYIIVEHYKRYAQVMAKFIGINHEVRHEFNISTSNRFRGYSAKMDDRLAVTPVLTIINFLYILVLTVGWLIYF